MNNPITKVYRYLLPTGSTKYPNSTEKKFRVFFETDTYDDGDFSVGMHLRVTSVNRVTGEVQFSTSLDYSDDSKLPEENNIE